MDILKFQQDLLKYFEIKDFNSVINYSTSRTLNRPVLDVIAFDELLGERHGNYCEERGLAMSDIIILNYGTEAWEWFINHLIKPGLFKKSQP
jgi:hypothetical protein